MATQIHPQAAQVFTFPTPSIDAQLEAKLERYLELKALNSEFNKLGKELKALFEGTSEVRVGKYTITGRTEERAGYEVKAFSFWNWKVSQ